MRTAVTSLLFLLLLTECQFSQSVRKDLVSGMVTKGDGLSCENVYLSVSDKKTDRNTFIYGEEFIVNFNNMEGFRKENDFVFPGMQLFVTGNSGDTVLKSDDLYIDYQNGVKLSPLLLTAEVTVASPMKSNSNYSQNVTIWDKNGNGKLNAKFEFKVEPNKKILIESVNVKYDEIYLFSRDRNVVIHDNKIRFNEDIYLLFEGLTGFKADNGLVFPGFSMKATDNSGSMIIDYDDLFAGYSESGLPFNDFNSQVTSHFRLTGSEFKNPMHCEMIIWDKKSHARIKAKTDLTVE
jgi:hypothetical protein